MTQEQDAQELFFDQITRKTDITDERQEIYQELIYNRFHSVLHSTFPLYTKTVEKSLFQSQLIAYIQKGSATPYVWQVPLEFKEFIKITLSPKKELLELLDFEWNQVKLFVSNHTFTSKQFDFNKRYKLSKNAVVKKYASNPLNQEPKTTYFLIFKDIQDHDVYYLEISHFLYNFLKCLRNKRSIEALKIISKKHNININEAKNIITSTLEDFAKNGIIV
jgi:hypothetical protein